MEHEVPSIDTLNHKEQPGEGEGVRGGRGGYGREMGGEDMGVCEMGESEVQLPALSFEAGMESDKKWMIRRLFKDMLLCLDPIYILMCVCTYHNK